MAELTPRAHQHLIQEVTKVTRRSSSPSCLSQVSSIRIRQQLHIHCWPKILWNCSTCQNKPLCKNICGLVRQKYLFIYLFMHPSNVVEMKLLQEEWSIISHVKIKFLLSDCLAMVVAIEGAEQFLSLLWWFFGVWTFCFSYFLGWSCLYSFLIACHFSLFLVLVQLFLLFVFWICFSRLLFNYTFLIYLYLLPSPAAFT